jgi:hypothetical protein
VFAQQRASYLDILDKGTAAERPFTQSQGPTQRAEERALHGGLAAEGMSTLRKWSVVSGQLPVEKGSPLPLAAGNRQLATAFEADKASMFFEMPRMRFSGVRAVVGVL